MNPVVLIATHNRIDITKRNIESLWRQSVKPNIFIVCTELKEAIEYKNMGVDVLSNVSNKPLGRKWQTGIDKIDKSMISFLIVTGSDDILGDGFIENACRLVEQGNHFVGLRQWYQHKDGKAYKCQYLAKKNIPLGGGRVYSLKMLKAINYQVFDVTKDKHLDDLGWYNVQKSGLKCLVLDDTDKQGLSIHAIKGDWPKINEFIINHSNVKLLGTHRSENVLPSFFNSFTNDDLAN